MAKGQQGVSAITVWMIVFVALWLTSTVFLVIMYTGQADLISDNDRLASANRRLISRQEENSLELVKEAREGGPTVVGLLNEAMQGIALPATGDETDDASTVRDKRDRIIASIVGDRIVGNARRYEDLSLHEALTRLYGNFRTEHQLRQEAETRAAEFEGRVGGLVKANADEKSGFEARAKQFSDELGRAEASHAAYRKERDEAIANLTADFEAARDGLNNEVTQARLRVNAMQTTLAALQDRLAQREAKLGELMVGPGELVTARQPDGTILTAVAGDPVVYVDLGRDDHVTLGLQFSVYTSDGGIPASGRSKAQVEVVSVFGKSSACRVIRLAPGEVIVSGDLIANPVFSPDRALGFVVFGEFDLDHDGRADRDGVAQIEAIIKAWGGKVAREISALTDFVVLGHAPRRPRASADESAELSDRQQQIRRAWDAYQSAVATARDLSIPVMTQEVFLTFLGQTGRVAAR